MLVNMMLMISTNSSDLTVSANSANSTNLTISTTPTSNEYENEEIQETYDSFINSVEIYAWILLMSLAIFCLLRNNFPKAFNIKSTVPALRSELAVKSNFGAVDWIWNVFFVDEDDFLECAGLDATCIIRILHLGLKISLAGCFTFIFLTPVYMLRTGDVEDSGFERNNWIMRSSLSNINMRDDGMYATVIASYIVFGTAMALILKDFKWYTKKRHNFLSRLSPENYTVYVRELPPQIRTSAALLECFRKKYGSNVVDACLALDIPELDGLVKERKNMVEEFLHLVNIFQTSGDSPAAKANIFHLGHYNDEDIRNLSTKIQEINTKIVEAIDKIEEKERERDLEEPTHGRKTILQSSSSDNIDEDENCNKKGQVFTIKEEFDTEKQASSKVKLHKAALVAGKGAINEGVNVVQDGVNVINDGVQVLSDLIYRSEDGHPRNAGFVSFKSLMSTASALQMLHSATPSEMLAIEAPLPQDIFWDNVGISNHQLMTGKLVSRAFSVTLCIFWTIPTAFVGSLTEVEYLQKRIPFLKNVPDWAAEGLKQISPLALLMLVLLLPKILIIFVRREGHLSENLSQASLFSKLALFYIIQYFFIIAISGNWSALEDLIHTTLTSEENDYRYLLAEFSRFFPEKAMFFMRYVMFRTTMGVCIQLLRILPLIGAGIRSFVGPNLTQEERDKVWKGLYPLSKPERFKYSQYLAENMLYFMVLFVYAVLTPFACIILALLFFISAAVYRHQFIFIYPSIYDTGGTLFPRAMNFIINSIAIAQVIISGVILLKVGATQFSLMIVLILITLLFTIYVKQQHFQVAKYLPSTECSLVDAQNQAEEVSFEFLTGAYRQPSLQELTLYPNDSSEDLFVDVISSHEISCKHVLSAFAEKDSKTKDNKRFFR